MFKKIGLVVFVCWVLGCAYVEPKSTEAKIYVLKTPEGDVIYTNRLDLDSSRTSRVQPYKKKVSYTTISVRPSVTYREAIYRLSRRYGVDPHLVIALITVESGFRQSAISPKGAIGLMQIMPETARILGIDPYDPYENLEGGIRHLANLLRKYKDMKLALAAYNAGQKAVDKYRGIPPYRETRNYVKMILSLYKKRAFVVYRYRTPDGVLHLTNKRPPEQNHIQVEKINMRNVYAPMTSIAGGFEKE